MYACTRIIIQAPALPGPFSLLWRVGVGGGQQDDMTAKTRQGAQTNEHLRPQGTHFKVAGWTGLHTHTKTQFQLKKKKKKL